MQNYNSKFRVLKFILLFLILNFSFLILAKPVSAHILKTDKTVGAVLHIEPEDDPIVGQQSGFFFEFKDTTGKLKLENCDCTFSILENGKQIYSQPLNNNLFFTFPQKDIYQIRLAGKSFSLTYDIRVEREAINKPQTDSILASKHLIHLIGAIIILIFVILAAIKEKIEQQSPQK